MLENFTMIKMTEISLTHMTKMRNVQCKNVVLEENKEFKYTLFSMCPLWKKTDSTIQTDFLSEFYSD